MISKILFTGTLFALLGLVAFAIPSGTEQVLADGSAKCCCGAKCDCSTCSCKCDADGCQCEGGQCACCNGGQCPAQAEQACCSRGSCETGQCSTKA